MKKLFTLSFLFMALVAMAQNSLWAQSYDKRKAFDQTVKSKQITGKYPGLFYPGSLTINKWMDGEVHQIAFNKAQVANYSLAFIKAGPTSGQSVPDINGNSTVIPLDHYTLTINYTNGSREFFEVYAKRGTPNSSFVPSTASVNIPGGYKKVKYTYENTSQPYYNFVRGKIMNRGRWRIEVDGVLVSNDYLSGISTPSWRMDHRF